MSGRTVTCEGDLQLLAAVLRAALDEIQGGTAYFKKKSGLFHLTVVEAAPE